MVVLLACGGGEKTGQPRQRSVTCFVIAEDADHPAIMGCYDSNARCEQSRSRHDGAHGPCNEVVPVAWACYDEKPGETVQRCMPDQNTCALVRAMSSRFSGPDGQTLCVPAAEPWCFKLGSGYLCNDGKDRCERLRDRYVEQDPGSARHYTPCSLWK